SYSGKEQTVEMMCSTESVYFSDQTAEGFLKYYDGKDYAFAAILPDRGIDIFEYVDSLTGDSLQSLLSNMWGMEVRAQLPKFKFEYSMNLKPILSDMGMPTAFMEGLADFSGMSPHSLDISQAVQKTAIELSPTGTKAAAASGAGGFDSLPFSLTLNRPFVYMILDTKTNLPLFIGVMTEM
ncbi:MAG: serine protease inhibitor, partial [Clostridia bacterium]|nr:serine protease inhibitor [Clostridia bacterium]